MVSPLHSDPPPISFFSNATTTKPPSLPVSLHSFLENKRNTPESLRMFPFPLNLSRRDDHAELSPADDHRVLVSEVDFFSEKKIRAVAHNYNGHDHDSKATCIDVKKEISPRSSLDVNVRTVFHLYDFSFYTSSRNRICSFFVFLLQI